MGHLKNKSELNLGAAELLHEQSFYPPVVHCAYYSCIQMMKHIWLNKIGKTEEQLKDLCSDNNQGSHEVIINQLKIYIKSRSLNDRDFNNDILQLKRLRVKSDYNNESIDYSISAESIQLSKSALAVLKKCI